MFKVPESYRIKSGPGGSDFTYGNNGAFAIPSVIPGRTLYIIASDGSDWHDCGLDGPPWQHVSVHVNNGKKNLTPTWTEMCQAKDLFWDKEDLVIQYHPAASSYVNIHPHVLHLWRPTQQHIPVPPIETI